MPVSEELLEALWDALVEGHPLNQEALATLLETHPGDPELARAASVHFAREGRPAEALAVVEAVPEAKRDSDHLQRIAGLTADLSRGDRLDAAVAWIEATGSSRAWAHLATLDHPDALTRLGAMDGAPGWLTTLVDEVGQPDEEQLVTALRALHEEAIDLALAGSWSEALPKLIQAADHFEGDHGVAGLLALALHQAGEQDAIHVAVSVDAQSFAEIFETPSLILELVELLASYDLPADAASFLWEATSAFVDVNELRDGEVARIIRPWVEDAPEDADPYLLLCVPLYGDEFALQSWTLFADARRAEPELQGFGALAAYIAEQTSPEQAQALAEEFGL